MQLEEIKLKSRKLLFLNLFGENNTKQLGSGMEYEGSREYTTNDDIRHLNWRQMAKGNGATVKVYSEQKQLNIVLVYLISGSLNFGKIEKRKIANEAIVALSYASIKSQNRLNTIYLSQNSKVTKHYTQNLNEVENIYNNLKKTKIEGKLPKYKDITNYIDSTIKEKSIIFFIGDFLEDINISTLCYRHELYALIVRDKLEENLDYNGEYNFIDANNNKSKIITIDNAIKKNYKEYMQKHDRKLQEQFKQNNINYTKIYTTDKPIDKIVRMLSHNE